MNPQIEATPAPSAPVYEAPAIETVITLDELEREVHYAGNLIGGPSRLS